MGVFGEPNERERLVWQVRSQAHRLAVEGFGTETVWVPIDGLSTPRAALADPIAGVRAAVLVHNVADRLIGDYVAEARGAGAAWDEIADALGLRHDDAESDVNRAERAFEHVAGVRWQARIRWTCGTCGQRVNEFVPDESHPTDREDGHATDCTRHQAAIAAWRVESGWGDER